MLTSEMDEIDKTYIEIPTVTAGPESNIIIIGALLVVLSNLFVVLLKLIKKFRALKLIVWALDYCFKELKTYINSNKSHIVVRKLRN